MSSYLLFGTHCFISHKQENNPVVLKAIFLSRVRTMSLIFPWIFHPFISSVQWLSHVRLSVTPWTEAYQAFLSITNSWILLKLMSIKSVMPSNHVILVSPFSSCLQFFPASGFFSKELVLCIGYFLNDPADVGNLISGSSAFSKSSLNIWKFTVHIPLKPGLENFEHYFA